MRADGVDDDAALVVAPYYNRPTQEGLYLHFKALAESVELPICVDWNGKRFGNPNAREMSFSFYDLIEHAAKTRKLAAGTIIGSGTVSNADYKTVGSACIAERRSIESIETGAPKTDFMKFGDRVRIEMFDAGGKSIFGAIDQKIVKYEKA